MQVRTDLSQHLCKMSLGKGARHTKANAACAHRACCWQAALGEGPLRSALHGGLLKGLCKVFVVRQRWVSSGTGRARIPDMWGGLADGGAAVRAGGGAAARGAEGLRG